MIISRLPRPPFGYPPAPAYPQALTKDLAFMGAPALAPDAQAALAAIPGNTAKAHGRPYSTWLFFRADRKAPDPRAGLRTFLKIGLERQWHTSLLTQLEQWRAYQAAQVRARLDDRKLADNAAEASQPFGNILLTRRSFALLDPAREQYGSFLLTDDSFAHGMVAQRHMLLDRRDPSERVPRDDPWFGYGFEEEFDVALLLARNTRAGCEELVQKAVDSAGQCGLGLAHRENGFVWRPEGENTGMREPFGFRDGLSNLLFLQDDVKAFRRAGPTAWDPVSDWDRVLFSPPPGSDPATAALAGGSFVVLRKLEQNVAALREWEAKNQNPTARSLDEGWVDPAAPFVGRTREGCPLTGLPGSGRLNDFNYDRDPAATACPFHAHIRKANPRGSSGEPDERSRLFVRRGMVYAPGDHLLLSDRPGETTPDRAREGVGLLFTGYMGSIDRQFRFMHSAWLTNPGFLNEAEGDMDPLAAPPWKPLRGVAGGFVIPRGGGYFFAPPLPWINDL